MSNTQHTYCTDCYSLHPVNPVTLTDVDGATRIVCEIHTLSSDDVLARVEAYLAL